MARKYVDMDFIISMFDDTIELINEPCNRYKFDTQSSVAYLVECMKEELLEYLEESEED